MHSGFLDFTSFGIATSEVGIHMTKSSETRDMMALQHSYIPYSLNILRLSNVAKNKIFVDL